MKNKKLVVFFQKIIVLSTMLLFTSLINAEINNVPTGHVNVLFIGNSFTFLNGMPYIFEEIAKTSGKDITIGTYDKAGETLMGFWTDPNHNALNSIRSKPWDYIILEGWGVENLNWDPARDMQVYGTLFMDTIHTLYPKAKVLMYMVHLTPDPYPDDITMDNEQKIYESIANERPYSELVPVLWAWKQGFIEKPINSYWLYSGDNWHPGVNRSYISAISIYSSIFFESPIGLPIKTINPQGSISLTTSDASYFQNLCLNALQKYSTINELTSKFTFFQVDRGEKVPGSIQSICEGQSFTLGIQPVQGSWSWSWTGPNNFSATTREIDIYNPSVAQSGNYIVKSTDPYGVVTSQTFTVNIVAAPKISPYVQIAGGTWSQLADNTAIEGQSIKFSPLPRVATGWSWSGPNGFTSTLRDPSIPVVSQSNGGIYTVTYTNSTGCSDSFSFNITVNATALNELQSDGLNEVQIYPNPAYGSLFIKNAYNAHISISDITGHEILTTNSETQASELAVNIKKIPAGLYFITIRNQNNSITKKFILQ